MDPANHYRCLDLAMLQDGKFTIVPLRQEDLLSIMHWRNAQIDVLRQKVPLTEAQQKAYWEDVIVPTFGQKQPPQLLFSFLHQGELVGYGGLVHISWFDLRAEVSFLAKPEWAIQPDLYELAFRVWLRLMQVVAFESLGFQRLYTETYDIRPQHVRILETSGFEPEGRLRSHVIIKGRHVDALMHGCLKRIKQP